MTDNPNENLIGLPALASVEEYESYLGDKHELFLSMFIDAGQGGQNTLARLNRLKELSSWCNSHYQWLVAVDDACRERLLTDGEYRYLRRKINRLLRSERVQIKKLRRKIELEELQYELEQLRAKKNQRLRRSCPPRNAQFFLYLFLERKGREEAVGDALEEYSVYIKRVGKLRADILFYQEVGRCAWPFVKRMVAKVGGLVVIGEWLRKFTH
jgi:hypothetical protein